MSWVGVAGTVAGAYLASEDGGPSPQRQRTGPPPRFQRALSGSVDRLENARNLVDFVPFDPRQEESIDLATQMARQAQPGAERLDPMETFGAGRDMFNRTLSGEFLRPENNPALRGMIDDVTGGMTRQFDRDVLPRIGSEAQRAGAFGGARQGLAEARAGGEVTREIGDVIAQLLQGERQHQMQMLSRSPDFANAEMAMQFQPSQILGQAGGMQRQMEQEREMFPMTLEQQFGQALTPLAGAAGGTSTSTPSMPSQNVRMLQGGMGGAQLGTAFGDQYNQWRNNQNTTQTTTGRFGNRNAGMSGMSGRRGVR